MRRLLSKFHTSIGTAFPLLTEWSRLPSFTGWIALSLGIAAQKLVPWSNVFSSILYNEILTVAIVLSVVAAAAVSHIPVRIFFFAVAGFLLALSASGDQHRVFNKAVKDLSDGRPVVFLSASVESVPALSFGEYSFSVRADSMYDENRKAGLFKKTLTCFSPIKPPLYGTFLARGRYSPPRPADNPGAFDDFANSMANNVWGRFYIDTILQTRSVNSFVNRMSEYTRTTVIKACSQIRNSDYRAIVVASFLNDRSDLSNTIRDLFFKAGIYHLLALSGFNIAILATALFAFLALIPVGKTVKVLAVLICVWSYYLFIGSIPSLFRAVLMTTVVLVAYLFQRKPHTLNSLGLAGMFWLFFSPESLFTPSYQLSFFATLGLVTLYPALSSGCMPRGNSALTKWIFLPLCSAIFVSVSAFIATAPVLAYHFGTISFTGIIANLFAITLMSVAMWISLIGFFMQACFPLFVPFVMHAAEFTVDVMIRCSALVTTLPMSAAGLPALHPFAYAPYVLFFTGLCALRPGLSKTAKRYLLLAAPSAVLASAVIVLVQLSEISPSVTEFSLKKASLTGIRWPGGKLWLVGTGPEGSAFSTFSRVIGPWMRRNFSRRIDAVVVQNDPCNAVQSLEPLLKNAGVRRIISLSGTPLSCTDFPHFLREFDACLESVDKGQKLIPCPGSTFVVMPKTTGNSGGVKIEMDGSSVSIPDSTASDKSGKGAIAYVFSNRHVPVLTRAIAESHPLFRP
jgi:ComEC/Rec2-related protein